MTKRTTPKLSWFFRWGIFLFLLASCRAANPQPSQRQTPAINETPSTPAITNSIPELTTQNGNQKFTILDQKEFDVYERFTITNYGPAKPDKQNLWVALISSQSPYQEVNSREITPKGSELFQDEYENSYAEFDFSDLQPGTSIDVEIHYQITLNQLAFDLSDCQGELPEAFIHPELHIESDNPQIIALAQEITRDQSSVCERVEAIYNYIGKHLVYSYNGADWGAQAALGPMGADCTEYASLMIALSRALGIPARYFEGLLYLDDQTNSLARTEHAWVEVYLPGIGWAPVDPTLGRSSITRRDYFARQTPDHIIVTRGRNPSPLRGASYFSHIYWPGDKTDIQIEDFGWKIEPLNP